MVKTTSVRSVQGNGESILYSLERKPVKNINLRVRKDGTISVSANARIPASQIDTFVAGRSAFIQKARARFAALAPSCRPPRRYEDGELYWIDGRALRLRLQAGIEEAVWEEEGFLLLRTAHPEDTARKAQLLDPYLDRQCKDRFGALLLEAWPRFQKYGVALPSLRIRDMKTRWGSCLPAKGWITLNKRLLEAPRECVEYVVMHEFCHFLQPNHSKAFYALLTAQMPDWKRRKQLLETSAAARS